LKVNFLISLLISVLDYFIFFPNCHAKVFSQKAVVLEFAKQ